MGATIAAIGWPVFDRIHLGGPFAVSPHGLGIALGFLAGSYVFAYESKKRGYPEEMAGPILFWALVAAFVGMRLAYVVTHLSEFHSLSDVIHVERGGISQLGGVVVAVAVCSVVVRLRKLPLLPGLDSVAIAIPLGVVIGRIGDLIIGDHLGKPTSWLLAFQYRGGALSGYDCIGGACTTTLVSGQTQTITPTTATLTSAGGDVVGTGVHQTALYDLFIAMALILFLVWLNRRPLRAPILFLTYVIWYGTGRIVTDFFRVENRFFGLTGSQWTSVIAVLVALIALLRVWRRDRARGAVDADATDPSATAAAPDPDPV